MRKNKKKIVLLCVLCVLGILIPCTFFARKSLKNNEEGLCMLNLSHLLIN